jgi:hypothetical protein
MRSTTRSRGGYQQEEEVQVVDAAEAEVLQPVAIRAFPPRMTQGPRRAQGHPVEGVEDMVVAPPESDRFSSYVMGLST